MEFKGTKGKWEYSPDNSWECNVITFNDSQTIQLENTDSESDEGFFEMYANAKLIASAPDLLEALEFNLKILERINKPIFSQRLAIGKTKDAIKKAIG